MNDSSSLTNDTYLTDTGPVSRSADWADARWGNGCEHPDELARHGEPQLVERTFVFVDLCSFTRFCDTWGPARATSELDRFRSVTREVAASRGVRVAKWLGDGAMLVALADGPAIATAVEIVGRVSADGILSARGGVARGAVLLFDGDDHIGAAVNLAARLCDEARTGGVLTQKSVTLSAPPWTEISERIDVTIRGIEHTGDIHNVTADTSVSFSS